MIRKTLQARIIDQFKYDLSNKGPSGCQLQRSTVLQKQVNFNLYNVKSHVSSGFVKMQHFAAALLLFFYDLFDYIPQHELMPTMCHTFRRR